MGGEPQDPGAEQGPESDRARAAESVTGGSEAGAGATESAAVGAPESADAAPADAGPQPADADPPPADADPPPADADPPPTPAPRSANDEAHAWLGPDVRTPVGIPKHYRPTETSMHALLHIELQDFVGPLDLLLFLIREHDLDVLDIPIGFITERYLELLDTVQALPIDVAAEFLVMAAELAHIKSKMLLPPEEGVPVEMEDGDSAEDPRAELVRRLLEYQKYRDAARSLDGSEQLGRDVFARSNVVPEAMDDLEPGPGDFSIFRLVEAMADVLSRLTPEKQHEVIADTVTITERIELILAFGEARGMRFPFVDLFAGMESRRVVVMTFLAILEMARTGMLRVEQGVVEEAPVNGVGTGLEDGAVGESAPEDGVVEDALASAPGEDDTTPTLDAPPAARRAPSADDDDVEAAYRDAEQAFDEPRVRVIRAVADLPPLVVPRAGVLLLVLTGKRSDERASDGGSVRDDYSG